jgi:hypothetical protein
MASSTGVDVAQPAKSPSDDEKAVVGRAHSDRSSSIRSPGHGDGTARKLKSRHSKLLHMSIPCWGRSTPLGTLFFVFFFFFSLSRIALSDYTSGAS